MKTFKSALVTGLNLTFFNKLIKSFKMCRNRNSIIFIRQCEKEDSMKISFTYGNSEMPVQNFSFQRSKTESLESALTRIKSKIHVAMLKKTKKRKVVIDPDIVLPDLDIFLLKNGHKVDVNTKNIDAWTSNSKLIINSETYMVVINLPGVVSLNLPSFIMSRFPVYPKIVLEFCDKNDCVFKWFRKLHKTDNIVENDKNIIKVKNENCLLISEGFVYFPQVSDVGYKLGVSCIPQSENEIGFEEITFSNNVVNVGPDRCPFEDRHEHTKYLTEDNSMRIVSYNILADLYAETDVAKNELFSHCPLEFLNINYRQKLYLKEIIGYNADIICLQEVDKKVFHEDLVPVLSSVNLQGIFNEKGGQVAEGLACFYRDSKFKIVETHSVILSEVIKSKDFLQPLHKKILENEKLTERFMSRTTALQVTLLQSKGNPHCYVLVGNTHLYYHPDSDNVRLLQAATCLSYLENILHTLSSDQQNSSKTALLLCGDFNSCPEFGVYKLISERFLSSNCPDWKSNEEERVEGMDLAHSLQLSSACGTPQYTNFTKGFNGCLDYIFYDTSLLQVDYVVPFPHHDQVIEYIALPNKVFPSDHIALISTLKWK